jgi:hypothetical protein
MYYGIEIETECTRNSENMESMADSISADGTFYCKSDGSIECGFEMVSHPATYGYWTSYGFDKFHSLRAKGYRSYNTRSCGMHVHVSRKALSTVECVKLLLFFRKYPHFIEFISRRGASNRMDRWAAIDQSSVHQLISKARNGNSHGNRYTALNFENPATVEFRIFRGTLDKNAILRNIGMVRALCEFVRIASVSTLTLNHFRHFIADSGFEMLGPIAFDGITTLLGRYRELPPHSSPVDRVEDSQTA